MLISNSENRASLPWGLYLTDIILYSHVKQDVHKQELQMAKCEVIIGVYPCNDNTLRPKQLSYTSIAPITNMIQITSGLVCSYPCSRRMSP